MLGRRPHRGGTPTTKTPTKLVAVACLAGLLAAQDHEHFPAASQPPREKECEIEMIDPARVTREMLLARKAPLIIRGGAADWPALERWDKDKRARSLCISF
jgi:hypothetical protein